METTNIVNLGQCSEEQLDWVGDLTPPHMCITPDTLETATSLLEAGYAAVTVYAQPPSDLQQKQGEA